MGERRGGVQSELKDHREINIAGFHIIEVCEIVKFIDSRSGRVARGWGGGRRGVIINGQKVTVKQDE